MAKKKLKKLKGNIWCMRRNCSQQILNRGDWLCSGLAFPPDPHKGHPLDPTGGSVLPSGPLRHNFQGNRYFGHYHTCPLVHHPQLLCLPLPYSHIQPTFMLFPHVPSLLTFLPLFHQFLLCGVCTCGSMCVCVCMRAHVGLGACVHACVCVCVCVCLSVCA